MAIFSILDSYKNLSALSISFAGIGNIAMLLLPIALYLNIKKIYTFLAFFFLIETAVAISHYASGFYIAYYFWVTSFFLAAVGMSMLVKSFNTDQQQRLSAPSLRSS